MWISCDFFWWWKTVIEFSGNAFKAYLPINYRYPSPVCFCIFYFCIDQYRISGLFHPFDPLNTSCWHGRFESWRVSHRGPFAVFDRQILSSLSNVISVNSTCLDALMANWPENGECPGSVVESWITVVTVHSHSALSQCQWQCQWQCMSLTDRLILFVKLCSSYSASVYRYMSGNFLFRHHNALVPRTIVGYYRFSQGGQHWSQTLSVISYIGGIWAQ